MSVFFTSDWHLSHHNIMKYSNRPFSSVEEMNNAIIDNFYQVVRPGDLVYFLGDFSWDEVITEKFFTELPKNIHFHFIRGNHDRNKTINTIKHFVDSVSYMKDIKIEGHKITLCHYPMLSWNCAHWDEGQEGVFSIMLHGHSHSNVIEEKFSHLGKIINVSVDLWNFYPVSFDEILCKAKQMPRFWGYIKDDNDS